VFEKPFNIKKLGFIQMGICIIAAGFIAQTFATTKVSIHDLKTVCAVFMMFPCLLLIGLSFGNFSNQLPFSFGKLNRESVYKSEYENLSLEQRVICRKIVYDWIKLFDVGIQFFQGSKVDEYLKKYLSGQPITNDLRRAYENELKGINDDDEKKYEDIRCPIATMYAPGIGMRFQANRDVNRFLRYFSYYDGIELLNEALKHIKMTQASLMQAKYNGSPMSGLSMTHSEFVRRQTRIDKLIRNEIHTFKCELNDAFRNHAYGSLTFKLHKSTSLVLVA
jgi:hypothetical protein